ncbi:MAG: N-methyl-L-tryptophan oxidase [Chloroflexota bacterium]
MANTYEAIVLGAGAMGSAAAYHLAKAGQRVLLLEQFEIDHQKGSSYGFSRITRYAYEHPSYVHLMKSVFPAWSALEAEAGETLYTKTGGLDFGRPSQLSLKNIMNALDAESIPYELWTAAEGRKHFPQFQFEPDMLIIYQADSGILSASKCVRTHIRLAEHNGADIRANTPIMSITPSADGVEVKTDTDTFSAAKLVITAGSWAKSVLATLGLNLPLIPLQCQEIYFDTDHPADYEPSRFPTFIGHMLDVYDRSPYGIANHQDSGLKVGFHGGKPVEHPSEINYTPDPDEAKRAMGFTERFLPGVKSARTSRVCLYTVTPDEDFVIDKHPEFPHIVFAGGCSGHGFKFSTLIGSILTDLALNGATKHDISRFNVERLLNMPDPAYDKLPLVAAPPARRSQ